VKSKGADTMNKIHLLDMATLCRFPHELPAQESAPPAYSQILPVAGPHKAEQQ